MSKIGSMPHIKLPALGRPFSLGMLYDCRREELIPGLSLWDPEHLKGNLETQRMNSADFSIIAEDTLEDKSWALDIEAGLKLSFLGGLVNVSGSAKYLDDRASSSKLSRVTMKYKCTTRFESLTMKHLDTANMQYPDLLAQDSATHVVTGITYGAQVFFVFEKTVSDEERKKDVKGELLVMVKSVPKAEIAGDGVVKINEKEVKKSDKTNVKFYGDFQPPTNPTTYADAVRLYKDLPTLLGPGMKNDVPMTVWLHPLINLDSRAARFVREISANLVSQTEGCLEDLHAVNLKCADLTSAVASQHLPWIERKIRDFRERVKDYKVWFQQQLMPVLPKIRGGGAEESKLADIIRKRQASPFSNHLLWHWLDDWEERISLADAYMKSLDQVGRIKIVQSAPNSSVVTMSLEGKFCVCFMIQLNVRQTLLEDMRLYLESCNDPGYKPKSISTTDRSGLREKIRETICTAGTNFRDFCLENADSEETTFMFAVSNDEVDKPVACIYLYKKGKLVCDNFVPPSCPGPPMLKHSTHDSLEVEWQKPDSGFSSITHYTISYNAIGFDNSWEEVRTMDASNSFTIRDLAPGKMFHIRIRANCDSGVGPKSTSSTTFNTLPTSEPGRPRVWQVSPVKAAVEWSPPQVIGENVTISSYDVLCADHSEQWRKCTTTESRGTLRAIVELPINTPWRLAVKAKCEKGQSLMSAPSQVITLTKTQQDSVKNVAVRKSTKVSSAAPAVHQVELKVTKKNVENHLREVSFGTPSPGIPRKVMLLIGARGAGKTTFVNGALNYVLGVKWDDEFRFRLVDEDRSGSQVGIPTEWTSCYTLHHKDGFGIPYTLTFIDTPSISGSFEYPNRPKIVSSAFGENIDAIGFVTRASTPSATIDSAMAMLGDVREHFSVPTENVFILLTHADGDKLPVLQHLSKINPPYKNLFRFNNRLLYSANVKSSSGDYGRDAEVDKIFWHLGMSYYRYFFESFGEDLPVESEECWWSCE